VPDTPATQRDVSNLSASIRDLNTALTAQLDRLANQIQQDRDRADIRFVPRGEWREGRETDRSRVIDIAADVADLKKQAEADRTFRRQVLLGVALAAFSAIISVGTAVMSLLAGRG